MAEQLPTGTGAGNQPGATDPGQQPPATTGDAPGTGDQRFTQEEVNRFNAEFRRKAQEAEAEKAQLKAELEKVKQAQMSDQEKAIEDAKKEGRAAAEAEHKVQLRALKIEAAIGPKLAELAPAIAAKIPADTPLDEINAKVREVIDSTPLFKSLDQPEAVSVDAGGGVVTSSGGKEGWITEAQLQDPQFYAANKELVEKAVMNNWVR